MRARNLAAGGVVEDDCRVTRREPRPGRGVDQMTERVVSRLAKPQKQSGRQSRRAPGIGLRLVAIGQNGIENMCSEAGLGGMAATPMTIAKQGMQPPVSLAATREVIDQLDMTIPAFEQLETLGLVARALREKDA